MFYLYSIRRKEIPKYRCNGLQLSRNKIARKKAPCHDRGCAFPNIGIEEFTSLLSERAFALCFFLAARHVSCSLAVSFGRSVEFRSLTSRRLSSPFVHPCEFNVHAKQTAAPARLSIICYIRPWPSNPSLTTPQTSREEKEGEGE